MVRFVRIGIVTLWLALVGALVRQQWSTPPPPAPLATAPAEARAGEDWLSVYHQNQKIGYVHQRSTPLGDGFEFEQHSLLRLVVMDSAQTVRTITTGRTDSAHALERFSFELSSGVGTLRLRGQVHDRSLDLVMNAGGDESTQRIDLAGPVYLPATLRDFVAAGELSAGRRFAVEVFDPAAMRNARMEVTVERRERVPESANDEPAWRVREEFRGIQSTAWIDAAGKVLREEGPMGLTLVRTDQNEAIHGGWRDGVSLDLVQSVAVPVARPIPDPRDAALLRLRLRGIEPDLVPSDVRQQRDGDSWTITREDLETVASYPLPYDAEVHHADLDPTPFLQSDHPRVRAATAEALEGERDAVRSVARLLQWIGGHMRQTPTVSIPNALQVLDERAGDCNEHAVLFAAMARAAGLPTRVVAGAVYQEGAFYYHAWNEVWLGRWVSVDPTFAQFPADATHLKLVEGGPEDHFAILRVIGRLGIDVLDSSTSG